MIDLTVTNDAVGAIYNEAVEPIWLDAPNRRLSGVFDSRYFEAIPLAEGEVGISTKIVSMAVKNDPLDGPIVGERVIVRDTRYRIKDKRPDGEGMAVLELEQTDD